MLLLFETPVKLLVTKTHLVTNKDVVVFETPVKPKVTKTPELMIIHPNQFETPVKIKATKTRRRPLERWDGLRPLLNP